MLVGGRASQYAETPPPRAYPNDSQNDIPTPYPAATPAVRASPPPSENGSAEVIQDDERAQVLFTEALVKLTSGKRDEVIVCILHFQPYPL